MDAKHTFDIAYGLAFNVERAETKSGFKPKYSGNAEDNYYFDLRLAGFASLLELGFAKKLCIVGGDETIGENDVVNRAFAITQMLVRDYGISSDAVEHLVSTASTEGNMGVIVEHSKYSKLRAAIVTNNYHIPRALLFSFAYDVRLPMYPAEAFLLAEKSRTPEDLEKIFGNTLFAKRSVAGIKGISDALLGQYHSAERPRDHS